MSVSWGTQYAKLKTNLRLASNRLRLLQKKKTEQAMKARTEIADFLSTEKEDRARIRVESIIREDFVVEAYELLEMFCELLLARFGLIQQMKELDDGIAEAVSSLLWVAPRISHEITEFKVINDQLQQKYGKQFAEAARMNQLPEPSRVSPKLVQKLSVSAPSKILVEKYLIEIARCANIDFTPDARVMRDDDDEIAAAERNLINFMNEDQIGWKSSDQQQQHHHQGGGRGPTGGPPPPPSGGNYGFGPGGGNGGGGGLVSYPQPNVAPAGLPSSNQPPAANVAGRAPLHYAPSEEAPSLPASAYAAAGGIDHGQPPVIQQQQQPYAPSTNQPQQQSQLHYPTPSSDFHPQQQQQHPSQPAQQPPAAFAGYPQYGLDQPAIGRGDSSPANVRKMSEHIYEVPPSLPDDFLSQFPDPPTGLPTTRGGGGLSQPPAASNSNAPPSTTTTVGDGLDFDDLAKRFRELKDRL